MDEANRADLSHFNENVFKLFFLIFFAAMIMPLLYVCQVKRQAL